MRAVIPIKPFGVAKQRLAPRLDAAARSRLGKAVAANTIAAIAAAQLEVAVITGDPAVAEFALAKGAQVIDDHGGSLSEAAAQAAEAALEGWLIVLADLPLLVPEDVAALVSARPARGFAIAPAADGGTSAIAGSGRFAFSYGPGSFSRHLAAVARAPHAVVVRLGLAVDMDTPADLEGALRTRRGAWLRALVGD